MKLVKQIDAASSKEDAAAMSKSFDALKAQLQHMHKTFSNTENELQKSTAFATQHDKRRAKRFKELQKRVATELKSVIASERAAEIAEASHAVTDPRYAADLAAAEKANGAMLESSDQAALGQVIHHFAHYIRTMRVPKLSAAELTAAHALLADLHASRISVKDAEVKMGEIARQEDLLPRGSRDDRSLIERFEQLVRKADFAPHRELMRARLKKWQRHELSDVEMLLYVPFPPCRRLLPPAAWRARRALFVFLFQSAHAQMMAGRPLLSSQLDPVLPPANEAGSSSSTRQT